MNTIKYFIIFIILSMIGFIYFSPSFNRTPPQIIVQSDKFTNLLKPVKITFKDKTGIRNYQVTLINGKQTTILTKSNIKSSKKVLAINVKLPSSLANGQTILNVSVVDNSKWHFFAGNKAFTHISLTVDTTRPMVSIVDNSYDIGNGGSAVAVLQINDKHLKNAYILVNNKYKFHLTPFYKKGYYASLIAWPLGNKTFNAKVIATDKAGNISQIQIPLYWKKYKYKTTIVKVPKAYILSKIIDQLKRSGLSVPNKPGAMFAKANSILRIKDDDELSKLTANIGTKMINSFALHDFRPLPGSKLEAYFAEHRMYYYNHKLVSQSYHQGIDIARYTHSKVYASNTGKVTTEKWLDLYGNILIVNHGFGLYTLFAHLSSYIVPTETIVHAKEAVAKGGATGDAFGPHLHFGVYVQGNAVNPFEWLDRRWIKNNITNILKKAKQLINQI